MEPNQENNENLPIFYDRTLRVNYDQLIQIIGSMNSDNQVILIPLSQLPSSVEIPDQIEELPELVELPELPELMEPNEQRGVRRSAPEGEEPSPKRQRIEEEQIQPITHIYLRTGEIIYFDEKDPTNILLTEEMEPDLIVRKIISKIPKGVGDRLHFLYKFIRRPLPDFLEHGSPTYYDDLRDRVLSAYMKEYKLRFIFRKALNRWRFHKMNQSKEESLDPITLSPPEKEVVIYDWRFKKRFAFEANTLALMIESKLMYHENGFPVPMYPKSPSNNVEFNYPQLISIYYQLKNYGELMWAMTTMRQCNFNKKRWYKYHKTAITLGAIKNSISLLNSQDAIELLSDFIFSKMEDLQFQVSRYITNNYISAMRAVPNHWYLEKWKYLAMVHFEGDHFGENRNQYINNSSFKLLQKQTIFFNELRSLNLIR